LCRAADEGEAGLESLSQEVATTLDEEQNALVALEGEMVQDAASKGATLAAKVGQMFDAAAPTGALGVEPADGLAVAGPVPCVAVCGVGDAGAGISASVLARLRDEASSPFDEPRWVDLENAAAQSFEKLEASLARCRAAIICLDLGETRARSLRAAREGLRAVLPCFPSSLSKVVLLSAIGAQAARGGFNIGWIFGVSSGDGTIAGLEDELTAGARRRPGNRPLRVVIVRAGPPPPPGCREGTRVAVSCFPGDYSGGGSTSHETVVEALYQALALSVDAGFSVLDEPVAQGTSYRLPVWGEILLPFIGPEVWRLEVEDARRAAFFAQEWAEEFFGDGKNSQRLGVKTPVQVRKTTAGVIFKFRPPGTPSGCMFEELAQGGIEILAETPVSGSPRLRARRCAYGWKVVVKKNSERALLQLFEQDWARASRPRFFM